MDEKDRIARRENEARKLKELKRQFGANYAIVADKKSMPEPVVTAEMPAAFRVIPGCFAGVGLLVHILVSKYCDHLPLYRQQGIFKI